MSELLAISFAAPDRAFALRKALREMQKDGLIRIDDAVVVTRDGAQITLHQPLNLPILGAMGGTVWGTVLGAIFLMPLAGAAVGFGMGALAARLTDIGINDAFMRDAARNLPDGGAACFVLLRKVSAEAALERIENLGLLGDLLRNPIRTEGPEEFASALGHGDVAMMGAKTISDLAAHGLPVVGGWQVFAKN